MSAPAISVLVSAWNYGCYLPACLDSIILQTVKPAEILIVDDTSTDGTETIGWRYAEAYLDLVRYERQAKRTGIVKLFNRWVPKLRSPWCCSVNADDWLEPTFLERHAEVIEAQGYDQRLALVYSAARFVCEEGAPFPSFHGQTIGGNAWNPVALMNVNFITGSAVFRKAAVVKAGGFPDMRDHEDWALWRKLALMGYRGVGISDALLCYRQHGMGHRNYNSDHLREGARATNVNET